MRDLFFQTLDQKTSSDSDIICLTANIQYPVLNKLSESNRLLDVGIAEQNMISLSMGLIAQNYKVFAISAANFISLRALEHLRNLPNRYGSNLKLIMIGAGFGASAELGATHFMTDDLGALTSLQNLEVYTPSDQNEALTVLDILLESNGFQCIRLNMAPKPPIYSTPLSTKQIKQMQSGVPILVFGNVSHSFSPPAANNKPTVIFSNGSIIAEAVIAAKTIAPQYHVQVYSCPKLPLNTTAYMSVIRNAAHVITFEEHLKHGGLGTAVAEIIATLQLNVPLTVMGIDNPFSLPVGNLDYLRNRSHLTSDDLVKVISISTSHNTNFE
jgi:transketolase